jgi:hypothetical protein
MTIAVAGRVICRQAPTLPLATRTRQDSFLPGVRFLCMIDKQPPLGENVMSNRRRKRRGQNKIAANLKVRLDRGAAKIAARSKRRAAKAAI